MSSKETVEIAVLYSRFETDRGSIEEDITWDLRSKPEPEIVEDLTIGSAVELGDVYEIAIYSDVEIDQEVEMIETLESLYSRLQGPRIDDEIEYNGENMRSAMMGDIFVIDGSAFIVSTVGFVEISADIDVDRVPPYSEGRDLEEDEATVIV